MTKIPPDGAKIRPRRDAQAEIQALLNEIPRWSDELLVHMHKRYGESRLFRVRHAVDGELTERARILRAAAKAEMTLRGLRSLEDE